MVAGYHVTVFTMVAPLPCELDPQVRGSVTDLLRKPPASVRVLGQYSSSHTNQMMAHSYLVSPCINFYVFD